MDNLDKVVRRLELVADRIERVAGGTAPLHNSTSSSEFRPISYIIVLCK